MLKKTNVSLWKKLDNTKFKDRKWELKVDGVVLGTIFLKIPSPKLASMVGGDPTKLKDKYSLYFSVPKIFAKIRPDLSRTHRFDTLEEAQQKFDELYEEHSLAWVKSFCKHYEVKLDD